MARRSFPNLTTTTEDHHNFRGYFSRKEWAKSEQHLNVQQGNCTCLGSWQEDKIVFIGEREREILQLHRCDVTKCPNFAYNTIQILECFILYNLSACHVLVQIL